jgi:alpha-D-xyloside xylohydrolase
MNPQNWEAITGLKLTAVLADKLVFATSAGPLEVSFWDEDIVRIRFGGERGYHYPIIVGEPSATELSYGCKGSVHVVSCGSGEIRLESAEADPLCFTFCQNGRPVVMPSEDGHFVRRFRIPPFARLESGWFFSVGLAPGASIYGFGEKYANLNKRGQQLVNWAEDALGVNSELCYKNVPFCWTPDGTSSAAGKSGYGVFINTTARVTQAPGYPHFSNWSYGALVEGDVLDLFFIAGDTPAAMIKRYTDITGRAREVPRWSLGVWMSRAYYKNFEEAEEIARAIRATRIPCDVFTLDGRAWLDTDQRFYFQWDPARYPEPEKFVAIMGELSLKLCVWEYPLCSVNNPLFDEFDARGWFVKDAAGATYRYEFDLSPFGTVLTPLPDSGLFDFTVPEAAHWWYEQHLRLHNMGVDVFKVDFGEQIPEAAFNSHGESGVICHNGMALLYNMTCFQASEDYFGQGLVWSRSGWAGSQRFATQWGGDPQVSWSGLAGSIMGGLNWGHSGAPFYAHDIGGFYGGPPDDELYVRWLQAGVCSAFCRIHGIGPREPWYFSERTLTIARTWLALRYRLIPYLQRQIKEATVSGMPVMRSMVLAFPEDKHLWSFELQYMLGDHLLIVPVTQPGGWVSFRLPPGVWYDYFTGSAQAGDQTITMQAPLETIPIFVREGGVVVEGPAVQHTGEIADGGRLETIRVFGFPGIHCLMHERDVAVSHTPERVDLSFEPGIRCEVHGARFTSEEGLLRIFSDR